MFDRMARSVEEFGFDPRFGSGDHGTDGYRGGWRRHDISVDVAEQDGAYVVTADVPGVERADIDLSVSGETLTIAAERESATDEGDDSYVHRERRRESMRRTVRLPGEVDAEAASATYTNGVLTVTLPTVGVEDEEDGHRIDID